MRRHLTDFLRARTRGFLLRSIAFAVVALAPAASADAQWRRLDSPNFVVIGDVPARDLRDVAVQFEGFRETLTRVFGARITTSTVPTVVVVFPTDRALAPFRPKYQGKPVEISGLFVPGRDVNYILLVNDGKPERLPVVLHEYTHLVTSNSDQPLPVWLSEGIAEYYSTFELQRGGREALIGGLIDEHLMWLNDTVLIPLNDLLKISHDSSLYNEGSRRGVLYAQSWAMTHMLLLGEPSRSKELANYLHNLSSGQAPPEAWQNAFGALNIQRELENYIRRRLFRGYKVQFSESVAKFEGAATAIPPADVQSYLADLQGRLGDTADARARLDLARKLEPANARALVTGARLSVVQKETDGQAAQLRSLATPGDWLLSYLAGISLAQLVDIRSGPQEDRDAIRRFLSAAHASRPPIPRAVAQLATMELASDAGISDETAAALTKVREQSRDRYEYAFLYAQMLARRKEFAPARDVVAPFMTTAYPLRIRDAARSFMGFLVDVESGRATTRTVTATAQPPDEDVETITLPVTRPVFRELKPGEERTQGTLDGFECVQGRGVIFSIKTADGVVSASAPTFNEIEFITYRDDLTGSVTCGPLKTPMPVYLTWKKGADGTSRIAVAIEFLPKPAALLSTDGPER